MSAKIDFLSLRGCLKLAGSSWAGGFTDSKIFCSLALISLKASSAVLAI